MIERLYGLVAFLQLPMAPSDPSESPTGGVPNPAPVAPPGLGDVVSDWIAWGKWISGAAGFIGLIACGVMMMIGRRNRGHLAGEGASGMVWVLGGLSLVAAAPVLVSSVLGG